VIEISAEPLNEAEPERSPAKLIVLAVSRIVAEPAFPEVVPVTLPVKFPSKVAATKVSEPTVHLSFVSSQRNESH